MEVKYNEVVGRYATASVDFHPGDAIFSETPFAFGPKADSAIICLGCYKPQDGTVGCSSCGWPVCGRECELMSAHRDAECVIFSKTKAVFYKLENPKQPCLQYECITPLRVLLAKHADPQRWKDEVEIMEAHNSRRKKLSIWHFNQINIVNYLQGPCNMKEAFDDELIHTVCGILESNAFEARTLSGNQIRCLYPKLAILSHNCVSNINHSISCDESEKHNFWVKVRAATGIHKGEELFSSYTYSLWPTLMRREHLERSKYFECLCSRCSDATELVTHLSTLKCLKCRVGLVTSTNPLDNTALWKCSDCENQVDSTKVQNLFQTIQDTLDSISNEPVLELTKILEGLYQKYPSILHSQNAYLCLISSMLIQLPKATPLSDNKVTYCKNLLKVLDVIEPGYSRIRGTTLFELAVVLINTASEKQENNKFKLEKLVRILEECYTILEAEPRATVEGRMCIFAKQYLLNAQVQLDESI